MAEKEEWRDVVGYEGLYQVSNLGNVFSCRRRKKLSPFLHGEYLAVNLNLDKKLKHHNIHRLVAEAFIDNDEDKSHVDHINGNKLDNRAENLRWVSGRENMEYATGIKVVCVEEQKSFPSFASAGRWCNEKGLTSGKETGKRIQSAARTGSKIYGYHWKSIGDNMGKMSREKGKRGEREVANILKEHGYDAKRGVQYQGSPDSPDVVGLPGVHIEVKRTEALSLYKALEQSKNDSGKGEMSVVVHRKNGEDWVAILPFEEFLRLYKEAENDKKVTK